MSEGFFTLPAVDGEGRALVFAPGKKDESLMPDNSELTMSLATKAFQMIGSNDFAVRRLTSR